MVMMSTVRFELSTNDEGSLNGAVVRLVNTFNTDRFHERMVIGDSVTFLGVIYGYYTLTITHEGYHTIVYNDFPVFTPNVSHSEVLHAK